MQYTCSESKSVGQNFTGHVRRTSNIAYCDPTRYLPIYYFKLFNLTTQNIKIKIFFSSLKKLQANITILRIQSTLTA